MQGVPHELSIETPLFFEKRGVLYFEKKKLFGYISRKVPEASAQDQHSVKKGETEGELVIGRVR